jgi:hypothetical protein
MAPTIYYHNVTPSTQILDNSYTEQNYDIDPLSNSSDRIFSTQTYSYSSLPPSLPQLPLEYTEITASSLHWIIAYCIVFIVAFVGNMLEFFAVWKRIHRIRCTPMNMLLINLCVADILVVIFVVGVEIGWRICIAWNAGRVMCKSFFLGEANKAFLNPTQKFT